MHYYVLQYYRLTCVYLFSDVFELLLHCCLPAHAVGADIIGPVASVLVFQPGTTLQCVTVTTREDSALEGNESFSLELGTADSNVIIGPPSSSIVTIADNDCKYILIHHIAIYTCMCNCRGLGFQHSLMRVSPCGKLCADSLQVYS